MKKDYVDPNKFKEDLLAKVSQFIDICIENNEVFLLDGIMDSVLPSNNDVIEYPNMLFDEAKELILSYFWLIDSLNNEDNDESILALKDEVEEVKSTLADIAIIYINENSLDIKSDKLVEYWLDNGYCNPQQCS